MATSSSATVNVEVTIEPTGLFSYDFTSSSSKVKITDGTNIDIEGLTNVALIFLLTNPGALFTGFTASNATPSSSVSWTSLTELDALGVKPSSPWPPQDRSALSFKLNTAPRSVISYSLFAKCQGISRFADPKIYNDPDPVTVTSKGFLADADTKALRDTRFDAPLGLSAFFAKVYPMLKGALQKRASRY